MRYNNKQIIVNINTLDGRTINLKINDDICMNNDCLKKKSFNHKFLSASYPNNTLENILKAKPIFKSKNKKRIKNGFYQKINSIFYRVTSKHVLFRDKKNNIFIKIRYLK